MTLAWIDLETTGLDPQRDRILEVGVIVTDDDLVEKDRISMLVGPEDSRHSEFWVDSMVRGMKRDVVEMHTRSGLIDDLRSGRCKHIRAVEDTVLAFLIQHEPSGKVPMCGSSVHFDRRFLQEHMVWLESWFHYRNIDVSSLNEAAKRWSPLFYRTVEELKRESHRVLDDLEDSIELARHHRLNYLDIEESYVRLAEATGQ